MRKSITSTLLVWTMLALANCQPAQDQSQSETAEAPPIAVDLILTNGKVVTVDEAFTLANTVVVNEGRIVEVGAAEIVGKYDAGSLVDLQGKILMPGFIDSHTHIRGRPLRYIELGEVSSISEIQRLIRK